MRGSVATLAVIVVLALLASPARAESGVAMLNGGQETVVATMALSAGDAVDWAYSSGLSTRFSISRDGTEVFSTSTMAGTGTFTATANGQYTFKFENTGSNLSPVSYDIKRPVNWTLVIGLAGIGAGVVLGLGAFLWYRTKRRRAGSAAPMTAYAPPPPPSG